MPYERFIWSGQRFDSFRPRTLLEQKKLATYGHIWPYMGLQAIPKPHFFFDFFQLIGVSVCQHFQACMGHIWFLGGFSSMHASDDHECLGRIPVRAEKSGQGRTDKQKRSMGNPERRIVIVFSMHSIYHFLEEVHLFG